MKKKISFKINWVSAVGMITKKCSSTWGDAEPHPQYDSPCHYELPKGATYRHWVCHCRTPLCKFINYQEVRALKYRIQG